MGQTRQRTSLATVCPFVYYNKIKQSIYPEIINMAHPQTKAVYEGPAILQNIKYEILKFLQENTGSK